MAKLLRLSAIVAILATITGFAITSQGFEVQDVNLNNRSVWVLQTVNGQRYGQVNTSLMELTSANAANNPTKLLQSSHGVILYSNGGGRYAGVNTAEPINFGDDPALTKPLKASVSMEVGASFATYVGTDGQLYVSSIVAGSVSEPTAAPKPDEKQPDQKISAATITAKNTIFAFSKDDNSVREYDPLSQTWTSYLETVPGVTGTKFQLALIGETWVLLDEDSGDAYIRGTANAIATAPGGQLQYSSATGDAAYVATATGLLSVPLKNATSATDAFATFASDRETTKPVEVEGAIYATWMDESSATMYSSATKALVELDFNGRSLKATPVPTIQSNGQTAVINETASGWAWRLPDGKLIESTQNWALVDKVPDQTSDNAEVTKVNTPKSPVAENDDFGVRKGQLVSLPVLMNDHDANNDIVSIVPDSVQGLSGGFGSVRLSNNQQMLVVEVKSGASGTGSFSYKITDGTGTADSKTARVSLRVVAEGKNSAPAWCTDVDPKCLQTWPRPQVEPGGEVVVPILGGWIDPEGDRVFVSAAEVDPGSGSVGFTPAGEIVYQDANPSATATATVPISVHVSDVNGKESVKQLTIQVNPDPVLKLSPFVVATSVNEPKTVDISKFVSGAAGEVKITSLKAVNNSDELNIEQIDNLNFKVSGTKPGDSIVRVSISDENGESASFVRVNVVEAASEVLSSPPVSVLVSPGLDTSIDLFKAAYNPAGRALVVSDLKVMPVNRGALYADLIKGGFMRVRGKTANDTAGLIGVVKYTLSDGSENSNYTATGEAYVYEMQQPGGTPPVGVSDQVTVRAGDIAEVDVLANDVGSPGVPLLIDSKSFKQSCIKGGLVFPGAGKVRVVAPDKAGDYRCSYSIYASGHSAQKGIAVLTVHVVEAGNNNAPRPAELVGRVRAGETVSIPVPLTGVDPDGDSVTIAEVSSANPNKGFVSINQERTALVYSSIPGVKGQDEFTYKLIDGNGQVSVATRVKVAILDASPNIAPVTMVDYAEVIAGNNNKVVVDPIANDFDPRPNNGSTLTLVEGSVKPDAAVGSKNFDIWSKAISKVVKSKVTIAATDEPTTMRFVYTVTNSSGSTSDGVITIRVSKDPAEYSPEITDTFVTLAEMDNLIDGIDVVNRKVYWPTGDVGALKLSIWGDANGFSVVNGTQISRASAPNDPTLVVFKLEGTDYEGKAVESYGLMHVPGINPIITLDPDRARQEVKENASKDFKVDELVNLPGRIEVKSANTLGIRGNAKCENRGNGNLTYVAGSGAPWNDGCVVELRVKGSKNYSTVMIPITVIPENPEPELMRRQLTVVPGPSGATTLDLREMTTWLGHPDKEGLQYSFSGGNDIFKLSLSGTTLNIEAFGNSPSGASREVKISIPNHSGTKPESLVLLVGQPLNSAAVGGTLTLQCKATDAQDKCQVTQSEMNSNPGTDNPYRDTPLRFAPFDFSNGTPNYDSKGNSFACGGGVTLRASANAIYATWPTGKTPTSVRCSTTYYVLDAEDRLGQGIIEFGLDGVPGSVRGVEQVDYTPSSIKIEITPPFPSDPPVLGFTITDENNRSYPDCDVAADGGATECWINNQDAYDGTNPKAKHTFTIRAFNSIGESDKFQRLYNAYAYRDPRPLTSDIFVNVASKYVPETTTKLGFASVTISPVNDGNVKQYIIEGENGTKVVKPINDFKNFTVLIGAKPGLKSSITVTAVGRVAPPDGGSTKSSSATWRQQISGTPMIESVSAKTFKSGKTWFSRVVAKGVNRNFSNKETNIAYVLYTGNTAPTCEWVPSTNSLKVNTTAAMNALVQKVTDDGSNDQIMDMSSRDLSPITGNTKYSPMVCFTNAFGRVIRMGTQITTLGDPLDGVYKYQVAENPIDGAWLVKLVSTDNTPEVFAEFNGSKTKDDSRWSRDIYSDYYGEASTIYVRYCLIDSPKTCSTGDTKVKAGDDLGRTLQMKVTGGYLTDGAGGAKLTVCTPNKNLYFNIEGEGLMSGSTKLWQGDIPGSGSPTPQYTTNGTTWVDLTDSGSYYRIPRGAGTVTNLRLYVRGNSDGPRGAQGLTGDYAVIIKCQ